MSILKILEEGPLQGHTLVVKILESGLNTVPSSSYRVIYEPNDIIKAIFELSAEKKIERFEYNGMICYRLNEREDNGQHCLPHGEL